MDLALPANVCVCCKNKRHSVLLCDKCLGVAYCGISCQNKDLKKHRKACRQIEMHIMNVYEHPDDVNKLKLGFHNMDLTLEYSADEHFNGWLIFVYLEAASCLAWQYNFMCKKRMHSWTVKQLLKWKIEELKAFVFEGYTHHASGFKSMSDPEDIPLVMNCLTALGRYQEALDCAGHWRKVDLLMMEPERDKLLVKHFRKWVVGDYEKEDITQEFDLQTFVGSNSERSSVELSIAMSYCLVIIKLYVIAEMENHLSKRERFLTFMQGTHPRLGSHSNVIRIAGMTPAVRLISKYCDISTNPLNIPSIQISPSSLSLNQSHLTSLLEQIHSLNPHALFSMTGDYSLRKLDFQSEDQFLAIPAVQTSWSAGSWSRVMLERLQDKEREMLVGMARNIIKGTEEI